MLVLVPLPVSAKISPVPTSTTLGCKIIEHSCGSAKADDHHTIGGNRHTKIGNKELIEAGQELHYHAGNKIIIDAGQTLTASGGGSFLKLDASGVTLVGPTVKINSGGSTGKGTGAAPVLPLSSTPLPAAELPGINMRAQLQALRQGKPVCAICEEHAQ